MVNGLSQHFIANATPVHEQRLPSTITLQQGGLADKAGNFYLRIDKIHRQQLLRHITTVQSTNSSL